MRHPMSLDQRAPPFRAANMQLTGGGTDGGTHEEDVVAVEDGEVMRKVKRRSRKEQRVNPALLVDDHSGAAVTGDPHVVVMVTMDLVDEVGAVVAVP